MLISKIKVQNFRSIVDETLDCNPLTVIVGPNGSGKSSFLAALDMFYQPVAKYEEGDFYNRDTALPIRITVTYVDLTATEMQSFEAYVENDMLTVEKVMEYPSSRNAQRYHGTRLRHSAFNTFWEAQSGRDRQHAYAEIRSQSEYSSLPAYSNQAVATQNLQDWEAEHPDQCERSTDNGQFFGFSEVGQARLEQYTRFLLIPAVRDADDDSSDSRGSIVNQLLDLVVRNALSRNDDLERLRSQAQEQFDEIVSAGSSAELSALESALQTALSRFVPDAGVNMSWSSAGSIEITAPRAVVRLVEGGFPADVRRAGHGVQRAFILTLLQQLSATSHAIAQETDSNGDDQPSIEAGISELPSLIMAIEEPELYLHPNLQRHLRQILMKLANDEIHGVAGRTQILHSTHSPLLLDIQRFDHIRRLTRIEPESDEPRRTIVAQATLGQVAESLGAAHGAAAGEFTASSLVPRMEPLVTPWLNEGFFANVVVLVEGDEDRAAVLVACDQALRERGLEEGAEAFGVSVIPCEGKSNIDRPMAIFQALQIPTFVIWDNDRGTNNEEQQKKTNRALLRLVGAPEEDWPDAIGDRHACFEPNLTKRIQLEIGQELYGQLKEQICTEYSYDSARALKNPVLVGRLLERASEAGAPCTSIETVAGKILKLLTLPPE